MKLSDSNDLKYAFSKPKYEKLNRALTENYFAYTRHLLGKGSANRW